MRRIFPFRINSFDVGGDDVWSHVRAPSGEGGGGVDPGLPAGRSDRHGELDSRRASSGKTFAVMAKDGAASSDPAARCFGEMKRLCANAWTQAVRRSAV